MNKDIRDEGHTYHRVIDEIRFHASVLALHAAIESAGNGTGSATDPDPCPHPVECLCRPRPEGV